MLRGCALDEATKHCRAGGEARRFERERLSDGMARGIHAETHEIQRTNLAHFATSGQLDSRWCITSERQQPSEGLELHKKWKKKGWRANNQRREGEEGGGREKNLKE